MTYAPCTDHNAWRIQHGVALMKTQSQFYVYLFRHSSGLVLCYRACFVFITWTWCYSVHHPPYFFVVYCISSHVCTMFTQALQDVTAKCQDIFFYLYAEIYSCPLTTLISICCSDSSNFDRQLVHSSCEAWKSRLITSI